MSKHDALPNPVWPFHSYCCFSEPDPTNVLHNSTDQTSSKKAGFFCLFGQFCDSSALQCFSWCRYHHCSSSGFLSAMGKRKHQGPGQNSAPMVLQEGTDVEQMFGWLQPHKRWGKDGLLWEGPHRATHRRDATIHQLCNEKRYKVKTRRRLNLSVFTSWTFTTRGRKS